MPEPSLPKERVGLGRLLQALASTAVPRHPHSFWYLWGSLILFFLLVQFATGGFLLLYYRPGPEAYESVRQISVRVDFGWWIRSLHSWAATCMIACIFIHMTSALLMRAYRRSRELTWWLGMGLLGVALAFGFTGYLLPMDQVSLFATRIGLEITAKVPGIGPAAADLIRGGHHVGEHTVHRMFTAHVYVLPFITLALLAAHLFLVHRHGLSTWAAADNPAQRRTIPFYPDHLRTDLLAWFLALQPLIVLSVLLPTELRAAANPLAPTPADIQPEWYFLPVFQWLRLLGHLVPGAIGQVLGLGSLLLATAAWALIPIIDGDGRSRLRTALVLSFGLAMILGSTVLAVWAFLDPAG